MYVCMYVRARARVLRTLHDKTLLALFATIVLPGWLEENCQKTLKSHFFLEKRVSVGGEEPIESFIFVALVCLRRGAIVTRVCSHTARLAGCSFTLRKFARFSVRI